MIWYRITLPYACYGIAVDNDSVVKAPPIAKWMYTTSFSAVKRWVEKKGGTIEILKDGEC